MRQCRYCKRWFKNKQAVRAHLRWCTKYRASVGPVVPPTTINIVQQPKSGPPKTAQKYRISYEGGYIKFDRRLPEIAADRDLRDIIWPVDICVIHRSCMVCPYCHVHLMCEDRRPLPASREGICPFCGGLFLY